MQRLLRHMHASLHNPCHCERQGSEAISRLIPCGAPMDYYTRAEAERAIDHAQRVILFCESHLV